MRRREFIAGLSVATAAAPLSARAQSERVRRVGVIVPTSQDDLEMKRPFAALRQALAALGWIEGRNIEIADRWAAGSAERARGYAKELVALRPDLIVAIATPSARAVREATRTIPVVFVDVSDPAWQGFVKTIAQPGGNLTGFTSFDAPMGSKWLEILKDIAPHVRCAAVIGNPETTPYDVYANAVEAAGPSVGIAVIRATVHDGAQIDAALSGLGSGSDAGLIVVADAFAIAHRETMIALAEKYRLPAIYPFPVFVKSGGLLSYGLDVEDQLRRSAAYVDRILKGAKPADLPVQGPTKFELAVNLKTAKAEGLTIPPSLLATADEVIE